MVAAWSSAAVPRSKHPIMHRTTNNRFVRFIPWFHAWLAVSCVLFLFFSFFFSCSITVCLVFHSLKKENESYKKKRKKETKEGRKEGGKERKGNKFKRQLITSVAIDHIDFFWRFGNQNA